ncbi:MAG: amino acid ABC transporter permease, partial [Marmoricola sp.]
MADAQAAASAPAAGSSAGSSVHGEDLVVVPLRHPGRWVLAVAVLVVIGFVGRAFVRADIDYAVMFKYLTAEIIVEGVVNTLKLLFLSMAMGLVLGVSAAVMKQSGNPVLRWVAGGYTWLFRGTPLLVQLLIWFNLSIIFKSFTIPGLYSVPMNTLMTPFVAALLGLGVNEGAYIAEIVRGGLLSIGNGQREAAAAIGMTPGRTMRRIILPQAMRVIVPPLGNEFIALLKYTSLAYAISYSELLHSANKVYTSNFKVIELLFTASIWYIALTTLFTLVQQVIERRLGRSVNQARPAFRSRLGRNL